MAITPAVIAQGVGAEGAGTTIEWAVVAAANQKSAASAANRVMRGFNTASNLQVLVSASLARESSQRNTVPAANAHEASVVSYGPALARKSNQEISRLDSHRTA